MIQAICIGGHFLSAYEQFGNYGIKSQQIFDILGYKVKWNGLDPENAEIVKI